MVPAEIERLDAIFEREIKRQPDVFRDAIAAFSRLFSVPNYLADYQARYGQFRWFTGLAFDNLADCTEEFVIDFVVGRQIPTALLLDVDVWNECMWYLSVKKFDYDPAATIALFGKMQEAAKKSGAIIGMWQGKIVTLAETIKQMELIRSYDYDSVKMAEFESRLKQIMFPKPEADLLFYKYFIVEPDVAVKRFMDLMDFFLSVTPDEIWGIVEVFLHPKLSEANPPTPKPASKPTPSTSSAPPSPSRSVPLPTATTPSDIRNQINSQFKKSADGNYENIEGVMAKLDELARKNNNPKIAEMLYWDEKQAKFVWQL